MKLLYSNSTYNYKRKELAKYKVVNTSQVVITIYVLAHADECVKLEKKDGNKCYKSYI